MVVVKFLTHTRLVKSKYCLANTTYFMSMYTVNVTLFTEAVYHGTPTGLVFVRRAVSKYLPTSYVSVLLCDSYYFMSCVDIINHYVSYLLNLK